MDVIAYADIYTALSEDRPYRNGLSQEELLKILHDDFTVKHGETVYNVIRDHQAYVDSVCKKAVQEGCERFRVYSDENRGV